PAPEVAAYLAGDPAAARRLTERIDEALRSVTLGLPSREEARLIARAADVWERPGLDMPRGRAFEEAVGLRRTLTASYLDLQARAPEKVAAVAEAVGRYDRLLGAARLSDSQVAADYPASPVVRFVAGTLARLLFHLPLALVGTVLNILPYELVGAIAHRAGRKEPDLEATFKLLGSLVLYPLCWAGEAALAGWKLGGAWALAVALAAPLTGWSALRFWESGQRLVREARGFLVLRTRGDLKKELRERRAEVVRGLDELAALLPERAEAG